MSEQSYSSSSSQDDEEDQCWDDWIDESADKQPCRSLLGDQTFSSVSEAIAHDKANGLDLSRECKRLGLDTHGRIRLINYIRKNKPSAQEIAQFKSTEPFLTQDEYLKPVLDEDPLLFQTGDWSDESDAEEASSDPLVKIRALERKLANVQRDFIDYKTFVSNKLDLARLAESLSLSDASTSQNTPPRDDDSHYFQSYGENDIHAVMIQDKVRTSSYASFILTNPTLFQDAIILDVGCGTGILSLFAARAGAKRVFAVDASDIALKAEQIVKKNGLEDIITVIHGKVEKISLPDDVSKVDVIISEWMGYALLYESMLDSVLHARDRFLKPGGVMAPSQCQMMLALCDASEVYKERISFWDDVYGFDMSVMAEDLYGEAIVDVVGPSSLLSDPAIVKDLHLGTIAPKKLDFITPFSLVAKVDKRTKVNAFVLYFDTFFAVNGEPVPEDTEVRIIKEGEAHVAELWRPAPEKRRSSMGPLPRRKSSAGPKAHEEKEKITSFSTGPLSTPTHWKQTLFLLKNPISIADGNVISGQFFCKKREENSRELDVEIHFTVRESVDAPEAGEPVVQIYTVR